MATFPDIGNLAAESVKAIERQARIGFIRGMADGTFNPFANLTREQAAILLDRLTFWQEAMARRYAPATVSLINLNLGTGAGFFVKDKASGIVSIATGRHVIAELVTDKNGIQRWWTKAWTQYVRTQWGLIRSDNNEPEPVILYDQDPSTEDLALVKLTDQMRSRLPADIPCIELDAEGPRVGEPCVSIGTPLSYDNVIADGIVSRDVFQHYAHPGEWFLTTAAINPGNSGGPVFSIDGRILGMALLKPWYNSAFGYAPGDDMGLVMTAKAIRAWCAKRGIRV